MKKSKDVTNTNGYADTYSNVHQNQYGEAGIKNNKRLFMYPGLEGEAGREGGTVTDRQTWQCGIHPARYSARPASGGRQGNKSWALLPVSTAYYIHHDK